MLFDNSHPNRYQMICLCDFDLHFPKSWLIGKYFDAGRDWGQEEKGTTEDEMAGWHHWLDGRECEWTPRDGDGQGGLACCNSWGRKESDTTERLNWTELNWTIGGAKRLFMHLSPIYVSSLENYPFISFVHFKNYLFYCHCIVGDLYIMAINSLSDKLYANIFFHYLGCLWFCSFVSFAMWEGC